MKKILFLGGSPFQLPPIQYAKEQGHYIITCDYLPDNPGHQLADEYHNISTTDAEAVLALATRLGIDGVVVFASDASAPTAAYVAEQLGLPGNPYESVQVLTRKDRFRDFLSKHHFVVPQHAHFSSFEDAQAYIAQLRKPVMIKPVDSSGSKGVSKITQPDHVRQAYDLAISFSKVGQVIVEEFIQRKGYQIAGDGFVWNENLVFRCFAQEHFNRSGNVYVPIGESFPLQLSSDIQQAVHGEIDRLMKLLGMQAAELNFDIMIDENDTIYLMEVAPRSGGNLISEVIKHSTSVNLAKYVVDSAIGLPCNDLVMYTEASCCSCYMLHSQKEGRFKEVIISSSLQRHIVQQVLFIQPGDFVKKYENAACAIGELILKFDSPDEMLAAMDTMQQYVRVDLLDE